MRILIADTLSEAAIERLRRLGHEVRYEPGTTAKTLAGELDGAEVLVVRSTTVPREALEASPPALVIRAGAGVNTIDVAAASALGIFVCNTPGKNALAVAELTIGLMMALDRRIADNVADLRAGIWNKGTYAKARGLAGRTLGIVGSGDIGTAVAERARALGMEVLVVAKADRRPELATRLKQAGCRSVENVHTMLGLADVVSIHVPATEGTENLVSTEFLDHMRAGAYLINTSRGDIVDEEALIRAMDAKGIRAGLDVFRNEPSGKTGAFTSKLAQHPNVYGTHHIGASTEQAQEAIASEVVDIVDRFSSGRLKNCVNLVQLPAGDWLRVGHRNQVGVLASILSVLRGAGINITHLENRLFDGNEAATSTIYVDGGLTDEILQAVRNLETVTSVRSSGR